MKIVSAIKLFKKLFSEDKFQREYAGFIIAEKLSNFLYPTLIFSEYARTWLNDQDFLEYYKKFSPNNLHSADRKFLLRSILSLVDYLEGDTAECGVFEGASSWLICDKFRSSSKIHHLFDSFEGLSEPSLVDGNYWSRGDLTTQEKVVADNLSEYRGKFKTYKGWIPERFNEVSNQGFCFVHVDVDLYEPTLESIRFFYPRLVKGGILLCDDYGFDTCPGATKAFDEYMHDKPEKIVHVPTGQGFIIKRD